MLLHTICTEKAARGQILPRAASRHVSARRICDSGGFSELSLSARHDTGERDLDSLVDVVRHVNDRFVERGNHARTEHRAVHPIEQTLPVLRAEQHDWYLLDFMRLNEREHLEHLIKRAEPSGEHDDAELYFVNCFVPEGPGLAKGPVASSVVRSLCLAHLVLTSHHEGMLLDCAIACVPRYMGLRTQHRVIDKTRFLLQPRYTQSEYANKNQLTYNKLTRLTNTKTRIRITG